ncbi:DUF4442 domain-containing protein [Spirosoma sp.]|uniref:DUF4442 domain-containing protein n=1 Tax=Spirosoma sp. TaxID=1899569 RepID=UPI003B3BA057
MKPNFLETQRKESFQSWRFRTLLNWYPMFFGTGGHILFWSGDWREVHVRLRRSIWTYNYVGTIFGGSMFSATDPFYMVMLLKVLGNRYVVWDKSASIRCRKPGRQTLYARFELTDEQLETIRQDVATNGQTERTFTVQWIDKEGIVYAEIERLCYVADKQHYEARKTDRQRSRFQR